MIDGYSHSKANLCVGHCTGRRNHNAINGSASSLLEITVIMRYARVEAKIEIKLFERF